MNIRKALEIKGFVLEKRKNKNTNELIHKNVPILIEFTFDGNRVKYPIGYRIDFDKWNFEEQIVKKNNFNKYKTSYSIINKRINHIKEVLPALYDDFVQKNKIITPKILWNEVIALIKTKEGIIDFAKAEQKKKTIFTYFDEYINEKKDKWARNTYKRINVLKTHLLNYYKFKTFDDFSKENIDDFVNYSANELSFNDSTNQKNVKILKSFLNWAYDKGYSQNIDFKKFKFKYDKTNTAEPNIIFLTLKELISLYNFDFSFNKRLEQVRDVYCFCCFTSLRYSDVKNLKKEYFKVDDNGDLYIEIVTQKTDDKILINLNNYSKALWDKYKNIELVKNKAFPVVSNQKFNEYLKECAKLAGIDSKITIYQYKKNVKTEKTFEKWEVLASHTARKTFITTAMTLEMKPEIIMKFTGHKDFKAMKPYLKIIDKVKKEAMSKFNEL